ncbi:B3 domain-containing protein At2g31720-like [Corylus avellana]|uniref:B3 domain-containing protein At2g31720-like n=1 Tax=Corylus avellana TaxID=13451 RepID=UPI00286BC521|nr:B3 domain-containing protein At2g31720-like [Corylus avellana]
MPSLPMPVPNHRKKRRVTLEDLRCDSTDVNGSFKRLLDEVKAVAKNEEEALSLTTERVLMDLIDFSVRKAHERRKSLDFDIALHATDTNSTHVIDTPKTKPDCPKEGEGKKKEPTTPLLISWARKKIRVQRNNPRIVTQHSGSGPPAGDMPTELKKKVVVELQGSDVKMVIKKVLTKTDLDPSCNRFLISRKKMSVEFLTEEEKENIVQKKEDGLHFQGMKVSLIEPSLKESSIWLKKWNVGKSMSYVLSSPWISVATTNGLDVGDDITLWSFRVDGRLNFALSLS